MCLIVFALHQHPDYPLILVANRDEFFTRPSKPAHFWPDMPHIFAGRDLESADPAQQGTWLGINRQGRVAAITNFREMDFHETPGLHSRGELTANYLRDNTTLNDYVEQVHAAKHRYKGYNLLLWEAGQLRYQSNCIASPPVLEPGIHGLSNGLLNTAWPKVVRGKTELRNAMLKPFSAESLLPVVLSRDIAPDQMLPDTGIGIESERLLSSCFIHSDGYGTRATTVVLIDRHGTITFLEQNWSLLGEAEEQRFLQLRTRPAAV